MPTAARDYDATCPVCRHHAARVDVSVSRWDCYHCGKGGPTSGSSLIFLKPEPVNWVGIVGSALVIALVMVGTVQYACHSLVSP